MGAKIRLSAAVFSLAVLSVVPTWATAQDIDQKIDAVITTRKAAKEAQEALDAGLDALNKRLADIGVKPISPPAPPQPADPLTIKLRDSYRIDNSPTKQDDALLAAELFKQCAELCKDTSIPTVVELGKRCKVSLDSLFKTKSGTLISVLKAELGAVLPKEVIVAPITEAERKTFAEIFNRFHVALLEAVK
jgi:hypothetical protein